MSAKALVILPAMFLFACNLPSPRFATAEKTSVDGPGFTMDIYEIEEKVQIVRHSGSGGLKTSEIRSLMIDAASAATSCPLDLSKISGDESVMTIEKDC